MDDAYKLLLIKSMNCCTKNRQINSFAFNVIVSYYYVIRFTY